MRISRQLLAGILILVVISGLSIYKFVVLKARRPLPVPAPVSVPAGPQKPAAAGGRMKGSASAPVQIVEYTDFQCPSCANASRVLEKLLKQYDGKIGLEHKHFPLAIHAHSRRASIFAECAADQGQFWPFHDVLFKSQETWAKMTSVDAYFSQLAVSMGLNGVQLAACANSPGTELRVKKDIGEGHSRQVSSTPTFFINGKKVVGAPLLVKELDALLGKKDK